MKTKAYIGMKRDHTMEYFRYAKMPTFQTHGDRYYAVIGPFRTKRGAEFMRDHGQNNPHCQTVSDAERLARQNNK